MTVSTDSSRAAYDLNGVTQIFSVPFYFFADTDLVVTHNAFDANGNVTSTVLTLNTDYTVSGADNEAGGSITTTSALAAGNGDNIVVKRVLDATQLTAYPANSPFPSSSHERALDKLTMLVQQAAEAQSRAVSVQDIGKDISAQIPAPKPGTVVGSNDLGTGFQNVTVADAGTGVYEPGFTGAVASRLVADKLRESVSVEDFGAIGDGVTNDAPAIQAAINHAASLNGGTVHLAAKTYAIASTLLVDANNVALQGQGANLMVDGGVGALPGTTLLWTGASGGTMVNFETPVGTGNAKRAGGGMVGVYFDGAATAAIGLRVCSWAKAVFRGLHATGVTVAGYKFTCWSTTQLAEAADTQYCALEWCSWTLISPAAVQNAEGILLTSEAPGTSTADTSLCRVIDCVGQNYNGVALHIADADNNYISNCRGFIVPGGSGFTILLDGTYSNVFVGCPVGTKVRIKGTASGAVRNSTMNTFLGSDDANSSGSPTVDSGCTYQWHGTKYGWQGLISSKACFGDTRTNAQSQQASINTETLRVFNSAEDHMHLTDGVNEWSLRIDGSGNLQFLRLGGTGTFFIPGAFSTTADVAITGYMSVKDSNGVSRKLAVIS